MGTPIALAVEPMDAETMRDVKTKLILSERAMESGDRIGAIYWQMAARKSLDEFKGYQNAA